MSNAIFVPSRGDIPSAGDIYFWKNYRIFYSLGTLLFIDDNHISHKINRVKFFSMTRNYFLIYKPPYIKVHSEFPWKKTAIKLHCHEAADAWIVEAKDRVRLVVATIISTSEDWQTKFKYKSYRLWGKIFIHTKHFDGHKDLEYLGYYDGIGNIVSKDFNIPWTREGHYEAIASGIPNIDIFKRINKFMETEWIVYDVLNKKELYSIPVDNWERVILYEDFIVTRKEIIDIKTGAILFKALGIFAVTGKCGKYTVWIKGKNHSMKRAFSS